MAIGKTYVCDLCGATSSRADFRRLAVRTADDRPDGATWVDVGPECHGKPIRELIVQAAIMSGEAPE